MITAPTGLGKTTFVLNTLLPYTVWRKREFPGEADTRMLILCNRRLLRQQYWFSLIQRFDRYREMEDNVEVKTYQQIAEEIKQNNDILKMFRRYSIIVCDEIHYFYADADFNGFGTYAVLQAIMLAGFTHTMVFMSATTKEVAPLLEKTLERACHIGRVQGILPPERCGEWVPYDFSHLADYTHFSFLSIADTFSLCKALAGSKGKSLVFIDDKGKAQGMRNEMEKAGIPKQDMVMLNADNLDSEELSPVINKMVMTHRLEKKVTFTTSVLDNGVSIEDPDVQNVVIITESPISFLQMLGRVRAGHADKANVYLLRRPPEFFEKRVRQYQRAMNAINEVTKDDINRYRFPLLDVLINQGNSEQAEILRKFLVLCPNDLAYLDYGNAKARTSCRDTRLVVNNFAREKLGDMLIVESRLQILAMEDPQKVIEEQVSWLGIDSSEVIVLSSTYKEAIRKEFVEEVCKIRKFSKAQMVETKEMLSKKFRKDLFPDVVKKTCSFSDEKFKEILARYGLVLLTEDTKEGVRYTVLREKGEEKDADRKGSC